MADEVSILVVASYHCIMSINSCLEHMHQARSVRKSYNYFGVL
jgi:hypothetical protein